MESDGTVNNVVLHCPLVAAITNLDDVMMLCLFKDLTTHAIKATYCK